MKRASTLSRYTKGVAVLAAIFVLFLFAGFVSAQADLVGDVTKHLEAGAGEDGAAFPDPIAPQAAIALLISELLRTIGIVFIALFVFGGYLRVTSHGNEDRIEKSTKTMVGAVIGLAIVLTAFAFTRFIATRVQNAAIKGDPVYELNEKDGIIGDEAATDVFFDL